MSSHATWTVVVVVSYADAVADVIKTSISDRGKRRKMADRHLPIAVFDRNSGRWEAVPVVVVVSYADAVAKLF